MPGRGPAQIMEEAALRAWAFHRLEANAVRRSAPLRYLVMPGTLRTSGGIVRFIHRHRTSGSTRLWRI
jgi:hypothetical protein